MNETAPVTVAAVDAEAASAFLANRFGQDSSAVETLRQGAWSSAYGFERDGTQYVIRFSNHLEDFARDQHAHRFIAPDLPIPVVTEIGEAYGAHYAISERMFGKPMDSLDNEEMRALLPSLFAMFSALRRADLTGTSGYGNWNADRVAPFASWGDCLLSVSVDDPAHRGHGWKATLEQSSLGMAAFNEGCRRLETSIHFAPKERFLVHNDLLSYNTLTNNHAISGVLDWGCSIYGDFLYDLAGFIFWAPWYPAWEGIDFWIEAKKYFAEIGLEIPNLDERMRLCLIHIGLSHISYNAFIGQMDTAAIVAERTLLFSE